MPKVSIIVPVYKTEKYLPRCIESILAQTFTDFELLIINDGSTDNSGKICDDYAQNDSRIVVMHKENGGASSARNLGLNVATGEWVMFVDSDDYLSNKYLSAFPLEINHDIEIAGMQMMFNNYTSSPKQLKLYNEKDFSNFFNEVFSNPYITSPCAKVYKRSILDNFKIRFDEKIKITEDTLFTMNYLLNSKSIYLIPNNGYYYRNPENIANKYRQNVDCMYYNLTKLSKAVVLLSNKFNFDASKIIQGISQFHYSCFSSNLELLSDEDAIKEWKKFRKYNLRQYRFRMTFKEYIYQFLCIYFPKLFYVKMRNRLNN